MLSDAHRPPPPRFCSNLCFPFSAHLGVFVPCLYVKTVRNGIETKG